MSGILVFVQHEDGVLVKATLSAISAAVQLSKACANAPIFGVSLGAGAKKAASSLTGCGIAKVIVDESEVFNRYLASNYASAICNALSSISASTLVVASTSTGKDFAPRCAAKLEAGQASDIVSVNGDGSLVRPMYAGDVLATVEITTAKKVITVRASAFAAPESQGADVPSLKEAKLLDSTASHGEVVGYSGEKKERPDLADASIVVSGGRALQSAENFEKFIFPLADSLGAAVGASRAAVDSGYAPNDWQVGQTGKIVAPNLYVAVGISGAIQHLAGMKDSKKIVAINKDADAPIFEVADYGLVADLYEVLPTLTAEIKKVRT